MFTATSDLRAHAANNKTKILEYVSKGLTAKEIGAAMCISPRTVENYIQQLKAETGARSVAHLAATSASYQLHDMKRDMKETVRLLQLITEYGTIPAPLQDMVKEMIEKHK